MKVLIISQYFWPENFRINDLAAGMVERGHKVSVLTGIPNYPGGQFFHGYGLFRNQHQAYKGVQIIRVPLLPRGKGGGIQLAINYFSFALFASVLSPFFCREKFDLIFVCQLSPVTVGLPAIVLKKIKSIPIMFWVQDIWPESLSATGAIRSKHILNCVRELVCFIYKHCDKILIQSPTFSSLIESQGVHSKRITFFPNSVEAIYKPVTEQSGLETNHLIPSGFCIMFAGNIGAAQDFETILLAVEKLKGYQDIHLVVLGDGRRFEWVKEEVRARGLSRTVHLLGRHPFEAMPGFFAQADAMLVTLKQDPIFALTIPAKIQSYMACEKPIIGALDGEGGRLITESGAGLSSPSGDADALAESILAMYQMPKEKRETMGKQGKAYCDANFEREMLIDKLEGLMRECIQQNLNRGLKS
jgi:glycosyltransferase involved in cell wall biosynthesis